MNFYLWGGSEIQDIKNILSNKFPNYNFEGLDTTTLGSLFSGHGKLADTVDQWYTKGDAKKYKPGRRIYKEIVTKDYFDKVNKFTKKDNYLIVSLTRECEARCQYGNEHVTLIKQLVKEKSASELSKLKFPELVSDILNDKRNTVMMDDEVVAMGFGSPQYFQEANIIYTPGTKNSKGEWISRFAELTTELFEDRILLLYTPPARRWINRKVGYYQELPRAGNFIHIFKNKVTTGKHFDINNWYEYHKLQRGLHTALKFAMRPYKVKLLELKWENLTGDDHHRLGRSPFHYDVHSLKHIAKELTAKIKEL
jgi:hypothetical protein